MCSLEIMASTSDSVVHTPRLLSELRSSCCILGLTVCRVGTCCLLRLRLPLFSLYTLDQPSVFWLADFSIFRLFCTGMRPPFGCVL